MVTFSSKTRELIINDMLIMSASLVMTLVTAYMISGSSQDKMTSFITFSMSMLLCLCTYIIVE